MKMSHRRIFHSVSFATILGASLSCYAQEASISESEKMSTAYPNYAVEFFFPDQDIEITPVNIFYRYWEKYHGASLKIADTPFIRSVVREVANSNPYGPTLSEHETAQFLRNIDAVLRFSDSVYFVNGSTMMAQDEKRLRRAPCALTQLIQDVKGAARLEPRREPKKEGCQGRITRTPL